MTTPLQTLEPLVEQYAEGSRAPTRRRLVIVNPYATTVSDRLKNLVVYALRGRYKVEAQHTHSPGHATDLCREAAGAGYDVVVAFGDDGTVNEAVNGLAGSPTALSCLPGGATNVYCRLLGIPNDVVDATEHLLGLADAWKPRQVDLGTVNGRCFAFSSGVGLDASVVERVDSHPKLKARLGEYYFTYAAVSTFAHRYLIRPPRLLVEIDGSETRGVTAIVQNAAAYTYFGQRAIELGEGGDLDDGLLSGVVLRRANPLDMPTLMWRTFAKRARIGAHRQVHHYDATRELRVRSEDGRALPLHVDGNYIGNVDQATYGVRLAALTVVS